MELLAREKKINWFGNGAFLDHTSVCARSNPKRPQNDICVSLWLVYRMMKLPTTTQRTMWVCFSSLLIFALLPFWPPANTRLSPRHWLVICFYYTGRNLSLVSSLSPPYLPSSSSSSSSCLSLSFHCSPHPYLFYFCFHCLGSSWQTAPILPLRWAFPPEQLSPPSSSPSHPFSGEEVSGMFLL